MNGSFWIQTFGKFQHCSTFYAHATYFFYLEVLTFKMVIKVSAWKPEVNENATLSTVNIAINDNHRLWPYNLGMPIFKWFSLIEALVISQFFGKFREKWNLKHKFKVLPAKWILCFKPFFRLFAWNEVLAFWNWIKFQDLIWLPKKLMNLSFFTKFFGRSVLLSSSFGKTFSYVLVQRQSVSGWYL